MCPVTVLKLDGCQVVAMRTEEKDGYTALQLGSGIRQGQERHRRPSAAISPRPKSSRSASSRNSASMQTTMLEVGDRDHGRPFRRRPDGRRDRHHRSAAASPARMKRWNFRGLRSHRTACRSRTARWVDRRPPGSGQDLQEQEDARPLRRRARHHAEPRSGQGRCRARPDHDPRARCPAPRAAG